MCTLSQLKIICVEDDGHGMSYENGDVDKLKCWGYHEKMRVILTHV